MKKKTVPHSIDERGRVTVNHGRTGGGNAAAHAHGSRKRAENRAEKKKKSRREGRLIPERNVE